MFIPAAISSFLWPVAATTVTTSALAYTYTHQFLLIAAPAIGFGPTGLHNIASIAVKIMKDTGIMQKELGDDLNDAPDQFRDALHSYGVRVLIGSAQILTICLYAPSWAMAGGIVVGVLPFFSHENCRHCHKEWL